ncbi:MAG: acyl-CoA dehydrogenase [Sphingomonadales bacterium RIFCSPHIGHO2_01_FULL_65_20]|jgi:(2S)-methylsuccinyl-CoA dehydrogenase|nr:MAG: acyl-CoA dehydrogenase [Sphingomonadales bacterium RIFCSPHIGHO2_01_FULL_65_20]
MTQFPSALHEAAPLLDGFAALLSQATDGLVADCAVNGRINAERFDRNQSRAFELASATADLLAGRAVASGADTADPTSVGLAAAFLGEAVAILAQRLDLLAVDQPALREGLLRLQSTPAYAKVLHEGLSAARLDDLGERLISHGAAFGLVDLDEDRTMMRDVFYRFGQDLVAPRAEEIHRHDLTVPEEILEPMREMGVFGLSVPSRYGGSAPDEREDTLSMMVVTEALSQASLAAAGSLITRPEIMTRAILAGGTEAQKAHWLPKVAVGQPLCGIAITEPDYGSDVAGLSLRATQVDGGWRLDGAKTWCTFAGKAGLLMVVARTHPDRSLGHRGLSILLVEKPSTSAHAFELVQDDGGRLSGKAIPTIGYRGMHSFDLAFENFFVPDANLLGGEAGLGRGFYFTMAGMTGGRMQTAARACGVMRSAIDVALSYAADRKVFGAALGTYQLTRAKLVRMAARYAASRQLAYQVARRLDEGEAQMEASLAKLFACRSAEIVTREALQIHGGMGYAEETPVSRYFVDARVLSIFEGAEETLALKVIARSLLDDALRGLAA